MFKRLLIRLLNRLTREELKEAYQAGVSTGYQLGYRLGQVEKSNRGFILSSNVEFEIEEILKEKGG